MCADPAGPSVGVMTYIDADGLNTYYEVTGDGDPVVLLHGGLCTVETLQPLTPVVAQRYRVYTPERRGHGRTAKVDGPISYANMAADTIAWLDALGLRQVRLAGVSDGGNVALLVALARPDLVSRLVVIGAAANRDGYTPEQIELFEAWRGRPSPAIMAGFKSLYGSVSPHGSEHFEVLFAKHGEMWAREPDLDLAELGRIAAPTLILLGDDDVLTVEHAAAMVRAVPDAQLAVVPGTSHAVVMEKPEVVNRLLADFFADEQVPRMMSLRDLLAQVS
jgi:pimeloyl-ACP methyl ester carboxylesterase